MKVTQVAPGIYEIPKTGSMNVPGRIIANDFILKNLDDKTIEQVQNVASLPGIVGSSLCMPDGHMGYGFPVGGVAAFDESVGIISPGGVGYDINCGVRLVGTNLFQRDVKPAQLKLLMDDLFKHVPTGVGGKSNQVWKRKELLEVLQGGAKWVVEQGFGSKKELLRMEEQGCMKEAHVDQVSKEAIDRGLQQLGTLGSGNHFLEVQVVENIIQRKVAQTFGLQKGQLVVLIHSGSRGLGHQIASDYVNLMREKQSTFNLALKDPQLACGPIHSREGQAYLGALNAGINFAFANRHMITHLVRESVERVFKSEKPTVELVYDVCHNIAKFENHLIDGKKQSVLVHRKGATRAFPAGRLENPKPFEETGHPVIVPGSMGTSSYVLVGQKNSLKWSMGSCCHGAGRVMSRHQAMQEKTGQVVLQELEQMGKMVRVKSVKGLAEEMPSAYKDIDQVMESIEESGIAKRVAQLEPLGTIKG